MEMEVRKGLPWGPDGVRSDYGLRRADALGWRTAGPSGRALERRYTRPGCELKDDGLQSISSKLLIRS